MTLAEAVFAIESHEFAARVGAASDWATFGAAVIAEDAAQEILHDASNARRIAERVMDIARMEVDPRYEHPLDTALATYLIVLSSMDRGLAQFAAATMLRIPQLWWAAKLARQTLVDATTTSTGEVHILATAPAGHQSMRVNDSDDMVIVIPALSRQGSIMSVRGIQHIASGSSSSERTLRSGLDNSVMSTRNLAVA